MRTLFLVFLSCFVLGFSSCDEDSEVQATPAPESESNLSFILDGEETTYRFGYKTILTDEGISPMALIPLRQSFLLTADNVIENDTFSGVSDAIFISIGRQFNRPLDNFRWDIDDAFNFPVVDGEVFSTGFAGYKDFNFVTREFSDSYTVSGGVLILSTDEVSGLHSVYINADAGREGNKIEGKWTGTFLETEFTFFD